MEQTSQLDELYKNKDADYYGCERSELLGFIPAAAHSVLDVGCGEGSFGNLLKTARNCEVWGIEPTEAARAASGVLDRVIEGELFAGLNEIGDKRFDAVCFNDVLEHMPAPHDALRRIKTNLSADGCVVASIPNVLYFPVIEQLLLRQDWKYEKFGVLDDTHLRFFTKKSIVRMFEDCGYRVEKIAGLNPMSGGRKYRVLNTILMNYMADWKYLQFAVVAKVV